MLQMIHAFPHPFLIKALKDVQNFILINSALLIFFFPAKQTGKNMIHIFPVYPQLQDLVLSSCTDCPQKLRSWLIGRVTNYTKKLLIKL